MVVSSSSQLISQLLAVRASLQFVQLSIQAAGSDQFLVTTYFLHVTFVNDNNQVCHSHSGEAVRNKDRDCSVALGNRSRFLRISLKKRIFGLRIKAGCGLVEQKDKRKRTHHRPSQGKL